MRKGYKQTEGYTNMKRGQVAIFVIIALVIVGVFVFYLVYPRLPIATSETENPASFIQQCIMPELEKTLETLSAQGGYLEPEHFMTHEGNRYTYLCYTDEDYKPCVLQQPLLVPHFEQELTERLTPQAQTCLAQLTARYEAEGYRVSRSVSELNVSLVPGKVIVSFIAPFEVSKDTTQTFRTFAFEKKTELYDLLFITTSILQFESTLGDSETTLYTQYYPNLIVEKLKKRDDTIYTVSHAVTKDSFRFATRSLIWPVGYGVGA